MRTTTTVVDVTETEHRDPLLPTLVAGMEALGFRVLGRVAVRRSASRNDYLYDAAERRRLATWRARPAATLMAADDGTSFAIVDTYGEAPLLQLRTTLLDGSLVETLGIAPTGAPVPRRPIDPLGGFTLAEAPHRSIRVTELGAPAELVEAHAHHVAERTAAIGVGPADHVDRADAVRLTETAAAHTDACADWLSARSARRQWALSATYVVAVLAIWFPLLLVWHVRSALVSVVIALAVVLALSPIVRVASAAVERRARADLRERPAYPLDRQR